MRTSSAWLLWSVAITHLFAAIYSAVVIDDFILTIFNSLGFLGLVTVLIVELMFK